MSERSDRAKLESALNYIDDIHTIVKRHKTVPDALDDIEGQYSLMMCIQQIGEMVNRIETEKYQAGIPVRAIAGFRNIIVHNYDGINLKIVQGIIEKDIPELEKIIKKILG